MQTYTNTTVFAWFCSISESHMFIELTLWHFVKLIPQNTSSLLSSSLSDPFSLCFFFFFK